MLEQFYEKMLLIRLFEKKIEELFTKGDLFGTTHACIGQEAVAVGVLSAINKDDIVTSNHRGHGHFIAFTDEIEGLLAELMGKECGVCGGRSGSQHIFKESFYANGITCGMTAVATGMAFAEKLINSRKIAVAFLGDGALGEGVLYESLNMASLWNIPIIFVLENNYYAMSTHISQGVAGSMADRGRAFGIETKEITTNDVEIIHSTFKEIVGNVRAKNRPFFFVVNTYRQSGHSKSDDCCYRTREEEEEWKKTDPLAILRGRITAEVAEKIHQKCGERIERAYAKIRQAGDLSINYIFKGLYQ